MNAFRFSLCALALAAGAAQARPIVIEEVATLARPDATWQYFGRFGVAIDGDYALVSGERFVTDPSTLGTRHEGAAFIYRRAGANWNYAGRLGPIALIPPGKRAGLAMKDGVAVTIMERWRIFGRAGTTWTLEHLVGVAPTELQGPDIEMDSGRILVARDSCNYESVVLRKSGTTWRVEGELFGRAKRCEAKLFPISQDLQGDRAIVHNDAGLKPSGDDVLRRYGFVEGSGWIEVGGTDDDSIGGILGPDLALSGPLFAVTGSRDRGTSAGYELDPQSVASDETWAAYGMHPVDGYLEPEKASATAIERVGAMFALRNFSFDRQAYVINVFRVNDDEARSSTHVATLQTKNGTSVGARLDTCGNRLIVSGRTQAGGNNVVRIFKLPDNFATPAVQVHDFELSSAGAIWQPTAGSTFSVARVGNTGVYRQASTALTAASSLPNSFTDDQAIQTEVTLRASAGTNAWVGLSTRRSDESNYYYVTLRTSGSVELKRMVDGVFTTLDSARATVTTSRRYRLRLESIGTVHRVYLNDALVLIARDESLTHGTAGIIMNRAAADYDNVIVTPSPFTTIFASNFSATAPTHWSFEPGRWRSANGVLSQLVTRGYGRAFVGAMTDDQIVQARLKPASFGDADSWVGVMARYQDEDNYLYVSLRGSGVISLWRRAQGELLPLSTQPFKMTLGAWYTVRIEIVNELTRVFVNNQLLLTSDVNPGPKNPFGLESRGQVGLITYKASADFDNFLAYQP